MSLNCAISTYYEEHFNAYVHVVRCAHNISLKFIPEVLRTALTVFGCLSKTTGSNGPLQAGAQYGYLSVVSLLNFRPASLGPGYWKMSIMLIDANNKNYQWSDLKHFLNHFLIHIIIKSLLLITIIMIMSTNFLSSSYWQFISLLQHQSSIMHILLCYEYDKPYIHLFSGLIWVLGLIF